MGGGGGGWGGEAIGGVFGASSSKAGGSCACGIGIACQTLPDLVVVEHLMLTDRHLCLSTSHSMSPSL